MPKMNTKPDKSYENRQKKVRERIEKIRHKIVIMSGKGGVGKTTVATNLAFSLSVQGYEVGLLDVDIHGPNVPKMLGIENHRLMMEKEGITPVVASPRLKVISMAYLIGEKDTPVIWRGPLKMQAIQQFLGDVVWGDLDYLIVDLPPGTGDEPLSIAQLIPRAHAVIVTTPQEVALLDARKCINFAKQLGMNVLGIIENMSGLICPHCGKAINLFKEGGGEKTAGDFRIPFLGKVAIEPKIVETGDRGTPFILEHPDSPASKAFEEIVGTIISLLKEKGRGEKG